MKRRLLRMLSVGLVAVTVVLCLSGCATDSGKRSASTLRSDVDRNAAESADEATTATSDRTESGSKPSDVETGSTATGTATQGNSAAGKVTGNVSPATKATRKPTTATTTKLSGTLTAAQAKSIAEDLVYRYHQYSECAFGMVCDLEYVEWNTVKKFATSGKNGCYYSEAYRITCCHSIDEVKQHISRCLDASLIGTFQEGWFFTDDKNNVYLGIDYGHGCMGYGTVTVLEYSADTIAAKAEVVDIDGDTGICDYFTIKEMNGNYVITSYRRDFNELK